MESMANYKSLASYRLLQSGWVQTVYSHKPETSTIRIFKADVTPSFKVNDKPHHPWVAIEQDGSVVTAHCDCKAGLAESCSHVGGILYKIEMVVRLGGNQKACTDDLCKWNHAEWKGVPPTRLSEVQLYTTKAKDKIVAAGAKRRRAEPGPMTDDDKQFFLRSLLSSTKLPVGLSLFRETNMNFVPRQPVQKRVKLPKPPSSLLNTTLDPKLAIKSLEATEDQRIFLEESTRSQSSSLVWYEQRAGRITSSNIHTILHTNQTTPAPSLLKAICSSSPSRATSEAMSWGRNHEDEAREEYQQIVSLTHLDAKVEKSGLCLHKDHPQLAASPDGFVSCSCCGLGLVEIKCPFTFRGQSVKAMLESPKAYLDVNLELSPTHKYYLQVQHQLFVTERKFCDFFVWLAPRRFCFSRIEFDAKYVTETVPTLLGFWENHVYPRMKVKDSLQPAVKKQTVHCSCGQPDDIDTMIGCDDDTCPHQWYHWSCVGIKTNPRAKVWYCKICKPKQPKKTKK